MSVNFPIRFQSALSAQSGCKYKTLFQIPQSLDGFFFQKKFRTCKTRGLDELSQNISRFGRANIRTLFPFPQNFFPLFFEEIFARLKLNALWGRKLVQPIAFTYWIPVNPKALNK